MCVAARPPTSTIPSSCGVRTPCAPASLQEVRETVERLLTSIGLASVKGVYAVQIIVVDAGSPCVCFLDCEGHRRKFSSVHDAFPGHLVLVRGLCVNKCRRSVVRLAAMLKCFVGKLH
jgi:hypothetical protein